MGYVVPYAGPPSLVSFTILPHVAAWTFTAVMALIVGQRNWRLGIRATPDGVFLRNFWRSYELKRSDVVAVEWVDWPKSIFALSAWPGCPGIRLRDGTHVLVVCGIGGSARVDSVLESLGIPLDWNYPDGVIKRLWQRIRRRG